MKLRDRLRNFDQYRRQKTNHLETLLYRLINNDKYLESDLMPREQIGRILIVRNNRRIGNMYFLLPFVHQICQLYPNAKVDMVLNEPWQGQVFKNLRINHIYYSHFSFNGFFKWVKTMRAIQENTYDLVISPYSSTSDTIISSLVNGKNKISTYSPERIHVFPHSNPYDSFYEHVAFQPLSVLESLGCSLNTPFDHRLIFDANEEVKGLEISKQLRANSKKLTIAFFRGARGKKKLSDATWLTLLNKFEQASQNNIQWIEILSPDIKAPLRECDTTYQSADMRCLAATIKYLDGFISCDTGPLHLADAAGAKCLGLYTETDPRKFGVIKKDSMNIDDVYKFDAVAIYNKLITI